MQTNQPDILMDKKERNDFFIALATIALAGLFITQTSLISRDKAVTQDPTSATIIAAEADDIASTYIVEEKDIESPAESSIAPKRAKVNVAPPLYRTNKREPLDKADFDKAVMVETEEIQNNLSDMATEAKEEVTEIAAEVKEVTDEVSEKVQSESAVISANVTEKVNTQTTQLKEEATAVIQEATNEIKETRAVLSSALDNKDLSKKDCVIAIGLYEDDSNVSKLSSRLESEGYSVFTKDIKRFTQVGVYISCDPTMSKSVLSEIKEIYAEDAFIVEQ